MSKIADIISVCQDMQAGKAASDLEICLAEKKLGLEFADEYKDYLKAFGVVTFYGHEFTGISNSSRLNVADVTEQASGLYELDPDMYVIEDTAYEGILILQNRKGEVFQVEPNVKPRKISDSLADYIQEVTRDGSF